MVQDPKEVVENPASYDADPFQALYEALAAEAWADVMKKPHDKEKWLYDKRPPVRFRASEAGNCARRIYYRLIGAVPTPDPADLKLKQFEGNLQQDVVRSLFKEHNIPIEGIVFGEDGTQEETLAAQKEFEVDMGDGTTSTVTVSARADGRFPNLEGGSAIFEFKTIDHFKNYWLQKTYDGHFGTKGNDAVLERIETKHGYYDGQMQITMAIFGDDQTYFGAKNRSAVAYGLETPDGLRTGVFVPRDEGKIKTILRTFAGIKEAVETGKPPPAKLDGSMECSFCPFYYQCHGKMKRGKVIYPNEEGP